MRSRSPRWARRDEPACDRAAGVRVFRVARVRAQGERRLPDDRAQRAIAARAMGHRAARSRQCARARCQWRRRHHVGRSAPATGRHRGVCAAAAAGLVRRRTMRAHRGLAARRHAYRWNLRGIDAHGRVSARRADARDRLSAVRRDRSAAPRVAQLRRGRREPQRRVQRGCAASDRRRRRGRSADAVRHVSERRHPAHLDRLRPRAVPAVAAAACGAGTPPAGVAARRSRFAMRSSMSRRS